MVLESFGLADLGFIGVFFSLLITAIIYLAKKDEKRDKVFIDIIQNNTKALGTFAEMTKRCQSGRRK